MPRVKSEVWKMFIKTNTGGKCKLCHSEVKSTEGTTNLKKHLARRHPKFNLDAPQDSHLTNQVITHIT